MAGLGKEGGSCQLELQAWKSIGVDPQQHRLSFVTISTISDLGVNHWVQLLWIYSLIHWYITVLFITHDTSTQLPYYHDIHPSTAACLHAHTYVLQCTVSPLHMHNPYVHMYSVSRELNLHAQMGACLSAPIIASVQYYIGFLCREGGSSGSVPHFRVSKDDLSSPFTAAGLDRRWGEVFLCHCFTESQPESVSVFHLCSLILFPLQWPRHSPEDSQVLSVLYWWSPSCCLLQWKERVSGVTPLWDPHGTSSVHICPCSPCATLVVCTHAMSIP